VVPKIERQRRIDIQLDEGRLEAVWIGPGPEEAPTLIFLHEGLGCVALWRDVPARLVAMTGCGALVFSRLGYGHSAPCRLPRPIDFMHHEGATVLPRVIRQAGIGDHFLIGHSDGGSIALIHAGAASRPGLLGLVTLAAHVFCEDLTRRSIRNARERYLNGDLKRRLRPYHGDNTHGAFSGWCDVWLHPEFKSWNIEAYLTGIRLPLLAIQGEDDPYGSSAQLTAIASGAGGRVTTRAVARCGHSPHLDHKDVVLKMIADYVDAQRRAAVTS
jgi:pimeloyl-ACP methyl ester carboxylesterase